MWVYILCFSVIAVCIIMAWMDRRDAWREGVDFARKLAEREADHCRVLYNNATESGRTNIAGNLNAQAEILRALEMQLRWEMQSRFMRVDNPDIEELP